MSDGFQELARQARTDAAMSVSWFSDLASGQGAAVTLSPALREVLTVATADTAFEQGTVAEIAMREARERSECERIETQRLATERAERERRQRARAALEEDTRRQNAARAATARLRLERMWTFWEFAKLIGMSIVIGIPFVPFTALAGWFGTDGRSYSAGTFWFLELLIIFIFMVIGASRRWWKD